MYPKCSVNGIRTCVAAAMCLFLERRNIEPFMHCGENQMFKNKRSRSTSIVCGVGQSSSPCTAIPVECTPTVLEKVSSEAGVSVRHIFGTCKGRPWQTIPFT